MTDYAKRNMKHRGRNDIEDGVSGGGDDEEARGLLLDSSDNNSHSSKERKIQASSTTANSIKVVLVAIALMVGLLFVLQGMWIVFPSWMMLDFSLRETVSRPLSLAERSLYTMSLGGF